MRRHNLRHLPRKRLRRMDLRPGEAILIGVRVGWATRLLARIVGEGPPEFGQWSGRNFRRDDPTGRPLRKNSTTCGRGGLVGADTLGRKSFVGQVLSWSRLLYDQERALAELSRMAHAWTLFILINLYRDNPYSLQWCRS